MNSAPSAFIAPHWARNRHLQTVWAPLFRPLAPAPRRRERLALADGDFVNLDWVDAGDEGSPLVVLLHGLAGSGDSIYIVGMQHALRSAGISSVTMIFRGAGGEPNRLARTYHAGDTADLDALLSGLIARFPQRPLAAVGYSLGGNVLLKHLGEQGAASPLRAACSVCAPITLSVCADQLDVGLSRIYRDRLLRELLHNLAAKETALRAAGNRTEAERLHALGDLSTIRSFRSYDGRVIAALHGFRDADDYYRQSSARRFLPAIDTPTLLVHAKDDPFMTPDIAPQRHEAAPAVQLAVSPHGGHVGFVHGLPHRPRWWLEETIPAWLAEQLR
ncbi:MAG: hydrolase [Pseudomonadota bacterium]